MIFARYLALGSVIALKAELDAAGIRVPERLDGTGKTVGGGAFTRGHLHAILANPLYVGRLTHRGRVHEGQHPGLVDHATFDAVQARLAANHRGHTARREASTHLLAGRIRDDRGDAMTPSHTVKEQRRYRYYVSRAVLQGEPAGPVRRIAAHAVEAAVIAALRAADPRSVDHRSAEPRDDAALIAGRLERVTVHADALHLDLRGADEPEPIRIPWSTKANQRRREIVVPAGTERVGLRPMKVEDRARILAAIARSRVWVADLIASRVTGTAAIAVHEGCSERALRMMLPLALLSPRIIRAIVDHRLPRGVVIRDLAALPASWAEQERALGL